MQCIKHLHKITEKEAARSKLTNNQAVKNHSKIKKHSNCEKQKSRQLKNWAEEEGGLVGSGSYRDVQKRISSAPHKKEPSSTASFFFYALIPTLRCLLLYIPTPILKNYPNHLLYFFIPSMSPISCSAQTAICFVGPGPKGLRVWANVHASIDASASCFFVGLHFFPTPKNTTWILNPQPWRKTEKVPWGGVTWYSDPP